MTDRPEYVQIEPVGQCNLRCQMCSIQFRKDGPPHGPPAFLDWNLFQTLLDGFDRTRTLHLQGLGEPLMHPKFFEMVELAVSRGLTVTTNTNLTLLTVPKARRMVTSGLSGVHVSIDGATKGTYESIRIKARFERVLENLKNLMKAKQELKSETPRVRIVCVLMKRTLAELPALCDLAARHGVRDVFVQHLCHDYGEESLPDHYAPMRDFIDRETLAQTDPHTTEYHFSRARDAANRLGIELRLPNIQPKPVLRKEGERVASHRNNCDWPWTGAYVSYSGHVMPCCMISTPDRLNFGQIGPRTVGEIWESTEFNSFREKLDSSEPPEICRSCAMLKRVF